jgi:N-acyl-D-aspartate/D-glutamate deacylase
VHDLVIRNARLVDGSGGAACHADAADALPAGVRRLIQRAGDATA